MEKVIGIDLGTTNSCVAVVENGHAGRDPEPRWLQDHAHRWSPSPRPASGSVGHIAKRQAITNAENTVYAAKRLIGRKWNSPQVKNAVATSSYRIVEGPHDDVRIKLRDKNYCVPEISAMILQEMKVIAEDYLGDPVSKAVVTVPAYFNDNQRQATKDAGAIAGLDVIRIINEPTAAALAYGFGKDSTRPSRSTTWAAAPSTSPSSRSARTACSRSSRTAGDTFLGGEDFDARIIDWLVEGFKEEHEIDLRQDRMALQRLQGRGREGQVRAVERAARPRSTSPSSSRAAATRRSTCSALSSRADARGAAARTWWSAPSTSASRRSRTRELEQGRDRGRASWSAA